MVKEGDIFITQLERGFFGAFRVLKTNIRFDFLKKTDCYLIALTPYIGATKPLLDDERLTQALRQKRFAYQNAAHINIYSDTKKLLEGYFEYLGNLPLTEWEAALKPEIGDGEDGGFPLAGAIQKDFGRDTFLEWRWENEHEAMLHEYQKMIDKRAEEKAKRAQQNPKITIGKTITHALRFQDEKSDKFWRVEYAGSALAVNSGKTGTTGKYQIKEFDSPAACEKEAAKLIAAKIKKGYQPFPDFDVDQQLYIDDAEIGPHPLTSHPKFRICFREGFYYSGIDEEAPFGSDEGSDTLAHIQEEIRKAKAFDFAAFPKKLVEIGWDLTYLPATDLSRESVESLAKSDEMNLMQSDMVTYATAFAQIKITGRLAPALKSAALSAMRRMAMVAVILGWNTTGQPSEITSKMIGDLEKFPAGR